MVRSMWPVRPGTTAVLNSVSVRTEQQASTGVTTGKLVYIHVFETDIIRMICCKFKMKLSL